MDAQYGNAPRWLEYREGLCRIQTTAKLLTKDEAQQRVTQVLLAPTAVADTPLMIYMHSGLKKIYPVSLKGQAIDSPTFQRRPRPSARQRASYER